MTYGLPAALAMYECGINNRAETVKELSRELDISEENADEVVHQFEVYNNITSYDPYKDLKEEQQYVATTYPEKDYIEDDLPF